MIFSFPYLDPGPIFQLVSDPYPDPDLFWILHEFFKY
jgi:hypothetical protein